MTQFVAKADFEACRIAHACALRDTAPYAVPSYRKRDRDLRKRGSFKGKVTDGTRGLDLVDLLERDEMLHGDDPWFDKRWSLGEQTAVVRASAEIAQQAEKLGSFELDLGDSIDVTASAAIRWSVGVQSRVLVATRGTGYHVLLAAIASRLRKHVSLSALSHFDRHVLELHIAATVLVNQPAFASHVDRLLNQVGRELMPQPGSEGIAKAQLIRLGESVLEQAYGEIERIGSGLHQGRTDRLHRAWSRGFFVPRGVSLSGLLDYLRPGR